MIPNSLNNIKDLTNHQIDMVIAREIRHCEIDRLHAGPEDQAELDRRIAIYKQVQFRVNWERIETMNWIIAQTETQKQELRERMYMAIARTRQNRANIYRNRIIQLDRDIASMIRHTTAYAMDCGWVLKWSRDDNGDRMVDWVDFSEEPDERRVIELPRLPGQAG